MSKRFFDITLSLLGIIALSPIFIIVSFIILIVEGRPIFFKQIRVGKDGTLFTLYKYRTMRKNPQQNTQLATSHDCRITKIGAFLRYYKIDELPQLLNVFIGNMSFVGYRPELPYYVEKYTEKQKEILKYKPGIVDPATLYYSRLENDILDKSKNIELDYIQYILPKKLQLSLQYAKNANAFTDLKCIVCAIKSLFNH